MKLPVFDIKRYSINDGPGIRITLFFKGCPLSCIWCHNPEGISPGQNKLYTLGKCIACRRCIAACPQKALKEVKGKGIATDFTKCLLCGACAAACPTKAMEMAYKFYTVEELVAEVEKERPFFESSGGGVTLCGGEPLLQGEKLFPLLDALGRNGIHRAVDTSLFAQPFLVEEVARRCELFLVDLKMMDSGSHRKWCGVPNELILSNIKLIAGLGCKFIVRIPLIEGVNADEENLKQSARFLSSLPDPPEVELLPYHDIAKGKHIRLGSVYNPCGYGMSTPSDGKMALAKAIFSAEKIVLKS